MKKRRVVITGLGLVSPVGIGVGEAWGNLTAGQSGITRITRFDASSFSSQIAGEVKGFDVTRYLPAKEARRMDTFIHYGMAAAMEAFQDSGLEVTEKNAEMIGVNIGSGIGGLPSIEETHNVYLAGGARKISPFFIPGTIINMISGNFSIQYGLKGPNLAMVTACTTATHCIGNSARMIEYGDADVMVAGGSESTVCPLAIGGFGAARALSTRNDDPATSSRPWDIGRDGFVLGEGAGILVLEEYEHAKARGAKIYAELSGFGMSADAYHMTGIAPEGQGAQRSMRAALKDAGIVSEAVGYVNAHATATPAGDANESQAIEGVFGEHALSGRLKISATKSMTGHLLGGAGGLEAGITVLALQDQMLPPTINLDNPDPECRLNYVPHKAIPHSFDVALSNSFGFCGINASLVFRRWTE